MSKHMSSKYLFIFIDKQGQWACIERDSYLEFSYGDPCYIGRGDTTETAFEDLQHRIASNDWINLEGNDPRFPRPSKQDHKMEELIKKNPWIKKLIDDSKMEN
jgi:hypothetical protein